MQGNGNSIHQGLSYPRDMVGKSLLLADATWLPDSSWHVVDYAETIGHGEADFLKAVDNLLTWRAHRAAFVRVEEAFRLGKPASGEPERGETVQLYFGPTVSPCRIIAVERSPRRVALVYGTMHGHIECGEEAFIIERDANDAVIGRCVAFSQHSWWLARLFSRPARVVQRWATKRYVRGMSRDLENVVRGARVIPEVWTNPLGFK
ncbi:DUF1990 domain-containing protein [Corynebacterium sp. J010B-136]|nr:DUF1990 domain-containing protein [Corynebacterium sp. J010B-136]